MPSEPTERLEKFDVFVSYCRADDRANERLTEARALTPKAIAIEEAAYAPNSGH